MHTLPCSAGAIESAPPDLACNLLTPAETADLLHVHKSTLAKARMRGDGPTYVRVSGGPRPAVRYRMADVQAFLDASAVHPQPQEVRA